MLLARRGQRLDQRLNRIAVFADEQPGSGLTEVSGCRRIDLVPTEFVACVRDRLGLALRIVLRRNLCQHIQSLRVIAGAAQERGQFFDPAVFEKPNGLAGRRQMGLLRRQLAVFPEPVLAVLERIGGQVELAAGSLLHSAEVGQMSQCVGVGQGFGDLAVVSGVLTQ